MYLQERWPLRTVAKPCMDLLAVCKLLLIVRCLVHKAMHASILTPSADSSILHIVWYIPTYLRHTWITVLNYVPNVSLNCVQFFSKDFIFLIYLCIETWSPNSSQLKIPQLFIYACGNQIENIFKEENFINYSWNILQEVYPAYIARNWEIERSFGWFFCCLLYSVTLVIKSLMHLA